MGMLLRRRGRKPEAEPTVNGKPVAKSPKTKKLNLEPDYVRPQTGSNAGTTVNKF